MSDGFGRSSDDSRVDRAHPDTGQAEQFRARAPLSCRDAGGAAASARARPGAPKLARDPSAGRLGRRSREAGAELAQGRESPKRSFSSRSAGAAGAAGQSSPTSPRPARAWADPKLQVYVGNLGAAGAGVREDAWKARLSDFFGRLCAIETSSFDACRRCGVVRFRGGVARDVFLAAGAEHTVPIPGVGDALCACDARRRATRPNPMARPKATIRRR